MKRKFSGLLAWGALALFVGVPSADVISNKATNNITNFSNSKSSESFTASELGTVGYKGNSDIGQGVRVVGDPRMARYLSNDRPQIVASLSEKEINIQQNIIEDIGSETIVTQEEVVIKEEVVIQEEAAISEITPLKATRVANVQPTKIENINPIKVPTIVQNVPNIKIVNLDNQQKLHKVDFLDLVANRNQGQRVKPKKAQNTQQKQRLDRINETTTNNQSEFYLYWQDQQRVIKTTNGGSFLQQLPSTRGNSIRLDLIRERG